MYVAFSHFARVALTEILQLFNRILAPYVENLDMNQVNYGIGQGALAIECSLESYSPRAGSTKGQLTLRKLRLKKGALDKFRLPVDVIEGALTSYICDILM